jgi:hypothetical protein
MCDICLARDQPPCFMVMRITRGGIPVDSDARCGGAGNAIINGIARSTD